jgi:hypothetical protein
LRIWLSSTSSRSGGAVDETIDRRRDRFAQSARPQVQPPFGASRRPLAYIARSSTSSRAREPSGRTACHRRDRFSEPAGRLPPQHLFAACCRPLAYIARSSTSSRAREPSEETAHHTRSRFSPLARLRSRCPFVASCRRPACTARSSTQRVIPLTPAGVGRIRGRPDRRGSHLSSAVLCLYGKRRGACTD